ncbi:MAG: hypothetical protein DLM52_02695 [Chthoniobacterales bacterium]|nr:MAG: hypothetical protein DLM52_02695 [Chthoniobacterales bacterium]
MSVLLENNLSIPIVSACIGVVILFFGRKLFWLCLAALGFAAGVQLASHLVPQPTPLLQLTLALLLGFIGALLALFLQKLAVALAGFLAGGRLAVGLLSTFLVDYASHNWLAFIVGGIIGALALLFVFDWALILVSSLIGAHLITGAINLPPTGHALLFGALVICGVIVQTMTLRSTRIVAPQT